MSDNREMIVWFELDGEVYHDTFDEHDMDDLGDEIFAWWAYLDNEGRPWLTATLRGEGNPYPERAIVDGPFDLWDREVREVL